MIHLRSGRGTLGYTFAELLAVMAIIAALALVATPWFIKISQRNTVKSAAREVQITLAAARMRAVKLNLPARVLLTPAGATYANHVIETFEMRPTPLLVNRFELSGTVEFPFLTADTPANDVVYGGDGRVTSACVPLVINGPCVVRVRGPRGGSVTNIVEVEFWRSGRLRVVTPTDWN